ncbi:TIGR00269 family protein [Candidatus Micrarchaeota archaeon]|nr:TIGR00269 family protein [Candidatus Micrarchaeota archaeon]
MVVCSRCSRRKAVMEQRYSALSLCKNCFLELFEKRVKKANRDFGLLRRGDRIAVAVSGGKDSAAMLYSLNGLSKKIGEIELMPVLVDEGIVGYRNLAMEKAGELCELLDLSLEVRSFKKEWGLSLDEMIKKRNEKELKEGACTYCGVFRKWVLNKAARELEANKVAIGHNADDFAQTFLMNLMRNEPERLKRFGPLSGIEEQELFVRRIKPLIYCLEKECALYAELKGIPYYVGECPYSGEAFRGIVKNFLNEAENKYPGVKYNILSSFLSIKKELSAGNKSESSEKRKPLICEKCGHHSSSKICKACEFLEDLA